MNLNREKIEELELADEVKNDILSLFDNITEKENEIETLRAKLPTDSQKVVDSVDYDKFQAATNELKALKESMQQKIETPALTQIKQDEPETFLAAFGAFFK